MTKKIPANKDWSLINDEGSSEGSIKENHQEVEKEIDKALSDSQRLINEIKSVSPPTQEIWIYFTNVAYSVTTRDLEDYYRKKDIRVKKVLARDAGTFKVIFDMENALRAASIPDNILRNRNMRLRLDRKHKFQQNNEGPRHQNSQIVESVAQKEPIKAPEESELIRAFKQFKLNDLHRQIIESLKGKVRS